MTDAEFNQRQSAILILQKEEIERLKIELAILQLILKNLNAPQK